MIDKSRQRMAADEGGAGSQTLPSYSSNAWRGAPIGPTIGPGAPDGPTPDEMKADADGSKRTLNFP